MYVCLRYVQLTALILTCDILGGTSRWTTRGWSSSAWPSSTTYITRYTSKDDEQWDTWIDEKRRWWFLHFDHWTCLIYNVTHIYIHISMYILHTKTIQTKALVLKWRINIMHFSLNISLFGRLQRYQQNGAKAITVITSTTTAATPRPGRTGASKETTRWRCTGADKTTSTTTRSTRSRMWTRSMLTTSYRKVTRFKISGP